MPAIRYRLSTDKRPLTYTVRATNTDGTVWTPGVGATFEVAYLTTQADPVSGDWKAGAFGTSRIGTVLGYAVVGPGSAIGALARGEYYEYTRVTDPALGVAVVACTSKLVIE